MFGDQWICECGTHNIELRLRCRECGKSKRDGKVADETAMDVMQRMRKETGNG